MRVLASTREELRQLRRLLGMSHTQIVAALVELATIDERVRDKLRAWKAGHDGQNGGGAAADAAGDAIR